MPYFALTPTNDDRRAKGMTALKCENIWIEKQPVGAGKNAAYMARPTPGRTRLLDLGANCRGVFCQQGCQSGALLVAAGSNLYSVSTAWTKASLGALPGGDPVTIRALRDKAILRAYTSLFLLDGTLTQVTDPDAPASAQTVSSVGMRGVAAFTGGDLFGWALAGDFLTWPANGQAADFDLSDPIVGQEEYNGDLWSLNAESSQIWRPDPTATEESEAFAPLTGVNIPVGLIGRGAVSKLKSGLHFLGHDRVVYQGAGLTVTPIQNRDLEEALKDIPLSDLAGALGFTYYQGSKEFWGLRTTLDRAYVLDKDSGLWHQRTKYGATQFDLGFTTVAYDRIIAGSPDSPYLWALDSDVYTDDGDLIERVMSFKVPWVGSVDRIVIDGRWFDQPTEGFGSAPQIALDYSTDGGQSWGSDAGDLRTLDVPGLGEVFRVQDFMFGQVEGQEGFLGEIQISCPIGFAITGCWINPTEAELAGRG